MSARNPHSEHPVHPENRRDRDPYETGRSGKVDAVILPVGVYGWRKYCLYWTLLIFLCLAIINLGLTVYVWRILEINSSGAGAMRFHSDKVRVQGTAEFLEPIVADSIASVDGSQLSVVSNEEISMEVGPADGEQTLLKMDDQGVRLNSKQVAMQYQNAPFFVATADETKVSSKSLTVSSEQGMTVAGVVQTNEIANDALVSPDKNLTINAVSRGLVFTAAQDVQLRSDAGVVDISAARAINVVAQNTITMSATQLIFNGIKGGTNLSTAFQVCVCPDGKLFRVDGGSLCNSGAPTNC